MRASADESRVSTSPRRKRTLSESQSTSTSSASSSSHSTQEEEYISVEERRRQRMKKIMRNQKSIRDKNERMKREQQSRKLDELLGTRRSLKPLVDRHQELVSQGQDPATLLKENEESEVLEGLSKTAVPLVRRQDEASGVRYTQLIHSCWRPFREHRENRTEPENIRLRKEFNIEVSFDKDDSHNNDDDGSYVAPILRKFKEMRLPKALLNALRKKGIKKPTPIQMQAIPVILSGKDCIGIAYTGSGKTLVFAIPMIMFSMDEELRMPLVKKEGPFGVIICPSRELAKQTHEIIEYICDEMHKYDDNDSCDRSFRRWPKLRTVLVTGGVRLDRRLFDRGVHMIVATPGRLKHCLDQNTNAEGGGSRSGLFNFKMLRYWCLDESDRLMDVGFEDDIRDILSHTTGQVQKVFFSATMPKKVIELAMRSMVKPITIQVGRAGAANLDVIQEVEYVRDEAKLVYLLECLKKTGPPVLVFCSNQSDVDDIHEYLLLKGINATATHGGKEMDERIEAVARFKDGRTDVLIATDVASKGLDFPDIKHVINFDMPSEIEDYIHRIGRTGRCGRTGVATTFININVPELTLLDLKGLLIEAKQRIPPILHSLGGVIDEMGLTEGCQYCGGLGHKVTACAKLAALKKSQNLGFVDDRMMLGSSY